jgi:hypothetical protein
MKRLGFIVIVLLFAASAFAAHETKVMLDHTRVEDPMLLTYDYEEDFPIMVERATTGFGDVLGQWNWSTLGITGNNYSSAGIAIDYPYLYLCNQTYRRLYQLRIDSYPPSGARYIMAPGNMPWGAGMDNDQEFWHSSYSTRYNYEYNVSGWPPVYTGNRFYNYKGYSFMGDISDNYPGDRFMQTHVGSIPARIYTFNEPSGSTVGYISNSTWGYTYVHANSYLVDNNTMVVGGWFPDRMWEISLSGTAIPGREFTAISISGAAYQDEAKDGTAKLWVQNNATELLQVVHWPPLEEDDIAVQAILAPNFPYIDPNPVAIEATIGNIGTMDQDFSTWAEATWPGDSWTSTVINTNLSSFSTANYTYDAFPNGLPIGTTIDICIYIDNPGDADNSNDQMCTSVKVFRECTKYATDDGIVGNAFYFYSYNYTIAKKMNTADTRPVTLAWAAVNTISRGEPYYPWPDPVYDPVRLQVFTDDDLNGTPGNDPVWYVDVRPADNPSWVIAEVPACEFLGAGGAVWLGMKNLAPGREGVCTDPYPIKNSDGWYHTGSFWYNSMLYGDYHIRGCLEWPPLVSVSGLDEFHWMPPYPQKDPNLAVVDFSMKLCGHVEGSLSASGLLREKMFPWEGDYAIPPTAISFAPPAFVGDGGETISAQMFIYVPIDAPEGVYNGHVYITHLSGIEELPFKFVIGLDPDLDIQDYAGDLVGNTMTLMGVRDGMAVGVFKMTNPNNFELNLDPEDGPANSHLFNGAASVTDLTFCAGGPSSKEPIPASDVNLMLGKTLLQSGEGTYGIVTVNIPFYAKHWHQQYDFGYCGDVTVAFEDRLGESWSDGFDIYLKVLKSHGGASCGFWGESGAGANTIHWSDLGLGEAGYALYRNGLKLADLSGVYEYTDPVGTDAAHEYSLGVNIGGSEVMIGPITVGGHRPSVFSLSQNYPNPVTDHTSIRYTIAEASNVSIGVYNSAGMLVKNLVNEYRTPGVYSVNWDNVDLSNGVYFYRMNAGDFNMTHKMVVMK